MNVKQGGKVIFSVKLLHKEESSSINESNFSRFIWEITETQVNADPRDCPKIGIVQISESDENFAIKKKLIEFFNNHKLYKLKSLDEIDEIGSNKINAIILDSSIISAGKLPTICRNLKEKIYFYTFA
ncbi:625_t:CDS:2 [Diversispora eburnea]|uniref:625_t:CDS:1 n=1 Tax=Diversispora eburnea TaxID=1213867 RepID=A0A9N8WJG0_9GLOM|nr:625_t:CDS:2 [Diversispora eburnea]